MAPSLCSSQELLDLSLSLTRRYTTSSSRMVQAGRISTISTLLAGCIFGERFCIGLLRYLTVSEMCRRACFISCLLIATWFGDRLIPVVSLLRYVTRFPCDTFGWYVAMVYLQVSDVEQSMRPSRRRLMQTRPSSMEYRSSQGNSGRRTMHRLFWGYCEHICSKSALDTNAHSFFFQARGVDIGDSPYIRSYLSLALPPPTNQKILRRLWNAAHGHRLFWFGILGYFP